LATPAIRTAIYQDTKSSTVGTATAITLSLTAPPAGQCVTVDWISYGYVGATQTSNTITITQTGGGTVVWPGYATGPVTGLCSQNWDFPGGMKCPSGLAVDFTSASMANCSQRCAVGYHFEVG
jgi:hypothetical protein